MGAIEGAIPSAHRISRRAEVVVVLVCVAAATMFVFFEARSVGPFGSLPGACERLRAAGLQMRPQDWFCAPAPYRRLSYGAASLLIALAYVLPCAILASTGRRLTALLPLAVGLVFGGIGGPVGLPLLPDHGITAKLVCLVALASPIAAIALVWGRHRKLAPWPPLQVSIIAALTCAAATYASTAVANWVFARHFGQSGFMPPTIWNVVLPTGVFGLLLGPDRRWWPWSLAPIALLLSGGPSTALLANADRFLAWSLFGLAVPVTAIGLVWCAWKPLTAWLNAKVERAEGRKPPAEAASSDPIVEPIPGRLRPSVVLNAVGVGLLAVSVIIFRGDPLPAAQATVLPTYLGLRAQAADARTKMDLRMAVATLDSYAAAYGNYVGFDAARATAIDPSLVWRDGTDPSGAWAAFPSLTMAIVPDSSAKVRIVAVSEGGAAFCMQRTPRAITFGSSGQPGEVNRSRSALVNRAIANCDAKPWSASAVRVTDTSKMCEGLDPYGGYVTCRMVQTFVAETLLQVKPH